MTMEKMGPINLLPYMFFWSFEVIELAGIVKSLALYCKFRVEQLYLLFFVCLLPTHLHIFPSIENVYV